MLLTFKQVKESGITDIASACSESSQFAGYVNQATDRLMTRGNWIGTVQPIQLCVYGHCLTWPRYVGTPLAVNVCGRNIPVQGNWFSFLPLNNGMLSGRRGLGDFFWDGRRFWGNRAIVTENDGWSPVFRQIGKTLNDAGNYVRAYPRCQADIGKTITFFGIDGNGQPVQQRINGVWSDGITLTLELPFASTPMPLRKVLRVVKDVTVCPINCYQYDANNNVLLDLAQYDPQETTPSYAHSVIRGNREHCRDANGNELPTQITALVKLAFQRVVNDTDLVLIDNLAALKLMIMAIKKEDAGDAAGSTAFEGKAIHELNLQLRDKIPTDQIPVTVESFGTAVPARRGIGRIL